jgi:transcriptional regulator with XRE-family HTH domain
MSGRNCQEAGVVRDIPIGERIRLFRLGRGMTQEQLAGLADVSPSWVSKAERGLPIDRRMAPLSKVAKVLGVTVAELVGQRLALPNGPDKRNGKLDSLRRAILPGFPTVRVEETIDLRQLLDGADETWRIRQACQYSLLSTILPGLIARGEQARRDSDGPDRSTACQALATIYASASSLSAELGEIELAVASVALASRMAQETGIPALEAITTRRTSLVLLRTGDEAHALDLCMAGAQEIETIPRSPSADEIAVHGSLLETAAFTAARSTDASSAWSILGEAERDAARYGLDRTHQRTAFSLGNVRLHGIAVALELGDFRGAARRAEELDPSRLPVACRQAAYWIDLARAHASMRNADDAVHALLNAERIAPEQVRYRIAVREMVREFLQHKRKSISPELDSLAKRVGVSVGAD